MPLYKSIPVNSQTILKIWKISETYNDLLQPLDLKEESLQRVKAMKSEIHQCGFLSVRHLLREFGYTDQDLYYDELGRPHLKDGKHISISHSYNYSAVIISDIPVGVDVEKQREKIKLIEHKFIDYEHQYLNSEDVNHIRNLSVIWCIKESLYKLTRTPGLSFKNHTLVIPFTLEDSQTVCWMDYKNKKECFKATYMEFDGFTCAFVLT